MLSSPCCLLSEARPSSLPLQILSLPCKHMFHADCATQWLRYKGFHATCPNCE